MRFVGWRFFAGDLRWLRRNGGGLLRLLLGLQLLKHDLFGL